MRKEMIFRIVHVVLLVAIMLEVLGDFWGIGSPGLSHWFLAAFCIAVIAVFHDGKTREKMICGIALAAVMVCLLALWMEQRMFQRRFARMSGEQKFLLEVKRNLWLLSKLGVTRKEAETLEELGERAKDKLSYLPAIEKGFAFLQGYEEYLYRTDRVSDVTLQMAVEEREQILSWLKCSHRLRYYRMVFRLRFIR